MTRPLIALVLALTLAAGPASATEDLLWAGGYGWIKVGMSIRQVQRLYRPLMASSPSAAAYWLVPGPSDDPKACIEYEIERGGGAFVMFVNGRVSRISLTAPELFTSEGVTVGDSEAKLSAAYKGLVSEPAAYDDPPAHDLYVWEKSGMGIRFEIDDKGKVAAIHGGDESIRFIEGCL